MNGHASPEKKVTSRKEKPLCIPIRKRRTHGDQINRRIAKVGMAGALGSLLVSGFIRFKGAKMLHLWSGWALVGFSMWHYLQNKQKTKRT